MKVSMQLEKPDEIMAELTIVASVKELKDLSKVIETAWPGWKFRAAIGDVISKAEKCWVERIDRDA